MSLLRDALRKAERAQEEARQPSSPQLTLEPAAAIEAPRLGEEQPAAFLDDVPEETPALEGVTSTTNAGKEENTTPKPPSPARGPQVREPDPRRPFYLAVFSLVVVAAAAASYFWLQLRAPASMVPSAASRPSNQPTAAAPKQGAANEPLLASTEEALASLPSPRSRPPEAQAQSASSVPDGEAPLVRPPSSTAAAATGRQDELVIRFPTGEISSADDAGSPADPFAARAGASPAPSGEFFCGCGSKADPATLALHLGR